MDRGPLNYYTWGIIKRRICVENVDAGNYSLWSEILATIF